MKFNYLINKYDSNGQIVKTLYWNRLWDAEQCTRGLRLQCVPYQLIKTSDNTIIDSHLI